MRQLIMLLILTISLNLVFAADPQIISIGTPSNIYYGDSADFNVNINTDGLSGTLNFWDNGSIVEQKNFTAGTTLMTFQKTWTTTGTRTITASLTNLSGTDDNISNSIMDENITIYKGIDFIISSVSTEPENVLPGQNITIKAFVENIGDTNFTGSTLITFYIDANQIGEVAMLNLAVGETKTIELEYTIPDSFDGEATIMCQINKISSVNEFNITNNSRVLDITEEGGINLRVNGISSSGAIVVGVMKEFTMSVENTGGVAASNIVIGVYKTVISPNTKIGEYRINSLNGHTIQEVNFSTFFATPGEENLFVFVDPLNAINEFNENDNDTLLEIVVEDSNSVMSLGDYLGALETLENNLNECQADLTSSRLERDVALENVASLTKERDSCRGNLNSCNENNTTFFVDAIDEIRETTAEDTNITQTYYFEQLRQKDDEVAAVRIEADKQVEAANTYALFGYAFALFLIILNVGNFAMQLRKQRIERFG